MAQARGVQAEPHSPWYGPGLIAALHMIGAMEQDCMAEFYYADLADWPLGEASVPRNGVLQIPDGPGLGVHVNEDIVAKYRVA